MTARAMLVRLESQLKQLGEHRQPPLVERAQRAIAKAILAQRSKLEAAIAAKIERHAGFAAVDCMWLDAGHAVFGGFKRAAA